MNKWIEPITDRSQRDITHRTHKAYLNTTDIRRIESNIAYLAKKLKLAGYIISPITPKTWEKSDIPKVADLEHICKSILTLVQTYEHPRDHADLTTVPNETLHYLAVNDMEQILFDLHRFMTNAERNTDLAWAMGSAHTGIYVSA